MHDLLNLYDLYELLILCYLDEPYKISHRFEKLILLIFSLLLYFLIILFHQNFSKLLSYSENKGGGRQNNKGIIKFVLQMNRL